MPSGAARESNVSLNDYEAWFAAACGDLSEADRLNIEALDALHGLVQKSDAKDRLIALLESSAPIEAEVRLKIAQALRGISDKLVRIDIGKMPSLTVQKYKTRQKWLKQGIFGLSCMKQGETWLNAKMIASERFECSDNTIDKAMQYASDYKNWCEAFPYDPDESPFYFAQWKFYFHRADIENLAPIELIKQNASWSALANPSEQQRRILVEAGYGDLIPEG